jgi:hypothetical protein
VDRLPHVPAHLRDTTIRWRREARRKGKNAKQVQRWLGHHSAAFTMSVYVHLLDENLGEPLDSAPKAPERSFQERLSHRGWRIGANVMEQRGCPRYEVG